MNEINKTVVSLLDSHNEHVYTSVDSANHCNDNGLMGEGILPEYLNSLNPQNLPPHEFQLRVNYIVMHTRNISLHEGLCNGIRFIILDLNNNLLKYKILAGDQEGQAVFFNRITLLLIMCSIELAFAKISYKAQGQTFPNVLIDLQKDVLVMDTYMLKFHVSVL